MNHYFSEGTEPFQEFDWNYLDLLNFDSTDFEIDTDDSSQDVESTSNSSKHTGTAKSARSNSKVGAKITKKRTPAPVALKSKSPFRKGMTIEQTYAEGGATPNMSRRSPTARLIVFPTFDKCDSLVYFPSTLCRHLNSADMMSITKLVATHFDKACTVKFNIINEIKATVKSFIKILDIYNCVEPDRILCVHSTKVVDNQIRATAYMKTTDSQMLYGFMEYTLRDPILKQIYPVDRTERFNQLLDDCIVREGLKEELLVHAKSNDDLLMYMRVDLVMTIDELTKKVVDMSIVHEITSVHPVRHVECKED